MNFTEYQKTVKFIYKVGESPVDEKLRVVADCVASIAALLQDRVDVPTRVQHRNPEVIQLLGMLLGSISEIATLLDVSVEYILECDVKSRALYHGKGTQQGEVV